MHLTKNITLLTALNLSLTVIALFINHFIIDFASAETMGQITLILTLYGFAIVLSTGNISTFVIKTGEFKTAAVYSLALSLTVAIILFFIFKQYRLLCFTLPILAISACIRGSLYYRNKVLTPTVIDIVCFFIRSIILLILLICKNDIIISISMAIITSSIIELIFLVICYKPIKPLQSTTPKFSIFASIALNSYIISFLGTLNDALVPYLTDFSAFGIFEGVVLPVLFFASVVLSCYSLVLLPILTHTEQKDLKRSLSVKAIYFTVFYGIAVSIVLVFFGKQIGFAISEEHMSGVFITMLAPVIPLIYLEIIFECILKGLGDFNFSTFNYICEYIIRISVLLLATPFFGVYGIAISYLLSNLIGNIVRFVKINKKLHLISSISNRKLHLTEPV
ncbi:MAG: polysaccharide biosynthesis C-terminal domain-containing protein [Ruminococcus sp.]|jgi:stage V sporulation protein B|nr:polysaccharide biosynthesis C-terminal domain-containing protein [Ruminococcus sp.]